MYCTLHTQYILRNLLESAQKKLTLQAVRCGDFCQSGSSLAPIKIEGLILLCAPQQTKYEKELWVAVLYQYIQPQVHIIDLAAKRIVVIFI